MQQNVIDGGINKVLNSPASPKICQRLLKEKIFLTR